MEVKPGWRQTELGIIPGDWTIESVKQLAEKGIIEKPLDGNHGNIHPKSSDYVEYGIPFVMANDFRDGQVDLFGCKYITALREFRWVAWRNPPPMPNVPVCVIPNSWPSCFA